jgi:predicted ester cyclase
MSSTKSNKVIVEGFMEEIFNRRNLAAINTFIAPDAIDHCKQSLTLWLMLAALPDFRVNVKTVIAEGDKIAVISTLAGSYQGVLMGVPASNQPVAMVKADIFRVANGKIVEIWQNGDYMGLMQQIGAVNPQPLAYHLLEQVIPSPELMGVKPSTPIAM